MRIKISMKEKVLKEDFRSESFSLDEVSSFEKEIRERQKRLDPKAFSNQKVKIK